MRKSLLVLPLLAATVLITLLIVQRARPDELATRPTASEHRAPAAAVAAPTPAVAGAPTAHLEIRVIGKTKRAPIAGATVSILPKEVPDHASIEWFKALPTAFAQPLTTSADGTVEVDPPASIPMVVSASLDDQAAGPATSEIPALAAGERREIVLELPDGNDAHVFGKVVTTDSHTPIAGARISLVVARLEFVDEQRAWKSTVLEARTTGADGSFEFDYPAWREPHLRVEADGYGVRFSAPLKECSDAGHPLLIGLSRSCTLRARVLDAQGRPFDALLVDLVAEGGALIPEEQQDRGDVRAGLPDERWHAQAGPDGSVTFSDLPAQTWIEVYLNRSGTITRPQGHGVELAPGETKEVEWRIGGGCALRGLVLDAAGQPVPQLRLWLTEAWSGDAPYFSNHSGPWIEQTGVTDESGHFELAGVPAGEWFLGPAPEEFGRESASANSIAPVPEKIVVGSERSQEVTLHVERGLYVRGRVVDPDGKPCGRMQIVVGNEQHRTLLFGASDEQGDFVSGPLGKQTVLVSANGEGRFIDSPQVRARAGDSGVELRLRAGGWIRGRAVDAATGAGCSANLLFTREAPGLPGGSEWIFGGSGDDGNFESPPCETGSYSISALTDDARWALVKGIDVTVGSVHPDVLLRVAAGGKLRLVYRGTKRELWVHVTLDGVRMPDNAWLDPGKPRTLRAPAGQLVLELRTREDAPAGTKAVELEAGETKEIEITDES
jgi:hypothetical protein